MIDLIRITDSAQLPDEIVETYLTSFPAEERRDIADMRRLIDDPASPYRFYIAESDGLNVGLITVWEFPEVTYVEHFAVNASARSRGLGGAIIDELRRHSSRPLLLEVEPPELSAMAKRRIGFYERHGFSLLPYHYMQPPYGEGLPWVELKLLSTAPLDAVDSIVSDCLRRQVYRVSD